MILIRRLSQQLASHWRRWFLAAILCLFIVPSTVTLVRLRWQLSSIFARAETVRLEEFQGFREQLILRSVELKGKDARAVLSAMPYAPDIGIGGGKMCAFWPHHRIVFVERDGTTRHLEVCFHCEAVSLRHDPSVRAPVIEMPFAWSRSLHRLFTDRGFAEHRHYVDLPEPPASPRPAVDQPTPEPPEPPSPSPSVNPKEVRRYLLK